MKIQSLAVLAHSSFNLPYAPLRKCGDIGRSIQAATDLAVGIATNATNAKMNANTNKTNKEIADATNAMNYSIHREDMNFNAEEAQKQREWDSPDAERQRLVDAGYNPLTIGSGFSSGGQSAASAPSAPSMQGATMNPNVFDFDSLSPISALARAAGVELTKAQTDREKSTADAIDVKTKFDWTTFEDRAQMEQTRSQFLLSQFNEYIGTKDFREASRTQQKKAWNYFNELSDRAIRDSDQYFDQRAKEYSWWKEVTDQERKKFPLEYERIKKELRNMDTQNLVMYAQRNKLIDEVDTSKELTPLQAQQIKASILLSKVNTLLEGLQVPQGQRQQFAQALVRSDNPAAMMEALDKMSFNGTATNWFTAMQKFLDVDYLKNDGVDAWLNKLFPVGPQSFDELIDQSPHAQ